MSILSKINQQLLITEQVIPEKVALSLGDDLLKNHIDSFQEFENSAVNSKILLLKEEKIINKIRLILSHSKVIESVLDELSFNVENIKGFIYLLPGNDDYYLNWHSDDTQKYNFKRYIGLSLNLSPSNEHNSSFQIRDKETQEIVHQLPSQSPGVAHFFSIDPKYEHRVANQKPHTKRLAFSAWVSDLPASDSQY